MIARASIAWLLLLVCGPRFHSTLAEDGNRLAKSSSPYLRLHADNPVHWFAWGPEALEAAKKQDKVIFLSVGYSACHWCHVMNRESFMDAKIAEFLNKHFICIKVDREERPDIDMVYMDAVSAMTGSGGWPLTAFLTPAGLPFAGGTYFPPEDVVDETGKVVRVGLMTALQKVETLFRTQRDKVDQRAKAVQEALRRHAQQTLVGGAIPAHAQIIASALTVAPHLDPVHGGLGDAPEYAPKFPNVPVALFLLAMTDESAKGLAAAVRLQADQMARGGIHDHIGGGFHRYSVDRSWTVPHFEKMLYDQALLLMLYSRLQSVASNPVDREAVTGIIDFLVREMRGDDGLFYAALDADSEHEEGKFYVWTREEIERVLGDDAAWFGAMMGIEGPANFEGKWVLRRAKSDEEMAKARGVSLDTFKRHVTEAKAKLLEAREARTRPFTDTKAIAAWNALTVMGLAEAAEALDDERARGLAVESMRACRKAFVTADGRLHHQSIAGKGEGVGFADDYAAMILALLAVHPLDSEAEHLKLARQLADVLWQEHWDEKSEALGYTGKRHERLALTARSDDDGALPSSVGLAALALVRLGRVGNDESFRGQAQQLFKSVSPALVDRPVGGATAMIAILESLR